MGFSTKKEAANRGAAIRRKLGKGWIVQTWENLGWHYKVSLNNTIHVYHAHGDRLHVMIGLGGAMNAALSPDHKYSFGTDPVKIVRSAVKAYKQKFDQFVKEQEEILSPGLDYISA